MWCPSLRLGWASLLFFLLCVTPALSLHESDTGVVDWHKQFVGVPLLGAPTTAPKYHPGATRDSSLLLTATSNNVLGALNATNGEISWRFIYEPEDRIAGFYPYGDLIVTLSGPGGSILRFFHASTGALVLEKSLHAAEAGHLSEPHHLGKYATFDDSMKHTFVLTNGHTVNKLDAKTGEVQWTWSAPDQASMTIYSHLVATADALYSIGITKSFSGLTLHVTSLNPADGTILASKEIPSTIKDLSAYLPIFANGRQAIPHLLWHEDGSLKSIELTTLLKDKPTLLKDIGSKQASIAGLVDVGLTTHGYIIALAVDGKEYLIQLKGPHATYETVFKFEGEVSEGGKEARRTQPIWSAGSGKNGDVWISRLFWEHDIEKAYVETFKFGSSASGQSPSIAELTAHFDFDTASHGIIRHATLLPQSDTSVLLALTTSSGAVQSWGLDSQGLTVPCTPIEIWTREESLATIVAAEFVELPEVIGEGESKDEGFLERLLRQIGDAKNFPRYLIGFIRRFVTGSYDTPVSKHIPVLTSLHGTVSSAPTTRDTFGFRQLLITATMYGKLYALDSRDGSIIWSRILGLGWAAEVGASIHPVKLFVLDNTEVVLVAQRHADNTLVDTVAFHFDALTGHDISVKHTMQGHLPADSGRLPLQGVDVISGAVVEAFSLAPTGVANATKAVLLLDEYLQVYIYPDTPSTQATLIQNAPTLHFPLRANSPSGGGQKRLVGHQITLNPNLSDRHTAYSTWTLSLPDGEDLKSIIPPQRGEVASLGKVLGNRTTLYKYLNPRVFILLTAPRVGLPVTSIKEKPTCGIYLVDAVKGSTIYRAAVPTAAGICDVKAALVENKLVYHYFDEEYQSPEQSKGWRLASVEFYEGKEIDDKMKSSDMSSFSDASVNVQTFEQSFVFPHAVTALAFTSTKFGMTSKDLIVASRNNQVQSIHHRLLNPRRPSRKVTAEEQEEFLISYDPVIPYEPKRVLSHNYEIANVRRIVTSPALLESTSLVFAHGLDMFLTRVSPSGTFDVLSESFNKAQLVLTIGGLAIAIFITKPMVRRKKLQERWYQ